VEGDVDDAGSLEQDFSALGKIAKDILDKRRYERMRAGLQIRYRTLGATEEVVLKRQGGYVTPDTFKASTLEIRDLNKVTCADTSLGGLKISTQSPLPLGTRLWLQVGMPGVPISINAIGEVCWSSANGTNSSCGLRFDCISKTDLDKVESFLMLQRCVP
jgi:hypothetical protein